MFCNKCGTKSLDGAKFCQKCGAKLITDESVQQQQTQPAQGNRTITQALQAAAASAFTGLKNNPKKLLPIVRVVAGFIAAIVVIAIIVGLLVGDDKYVQMVKGGTLHSYPQKTVGKAFDDYLSNPKWESGVAEDGERFVNVKGGILYSEKKVDIVVQFKIEDEDTFSYHACELNGIPQNDLIVWGLFETIYDYNPTPASQRNSNAASNSNSVETVRVRNNTGYDGLSLHISDADTHLLNELNVLGKNILRNGETRTVNIPKPFNAENTYNFLLIDKDNDRYGKFYESLKSDSIIIFTLGDILGEH